MLAKSLKTCLEMVWGLVGICGAALVEAGAVGWGAAAVAMGLLLLSRQASRLAHDWRLFMLTQFLIEMRHKCGNTLFRPVSCADVS